MCPLDEGLLMSTMQTSFFEQFDSLPPLLPPTFTAVAPELVETQEAAVNDAASLTFEEFRRCAIYAADGKIQNHRLYQQSFPYKVSVLEQAYVSEGPDASGGLDLMLVAAWERLAGKQALAKDLRRRYTSAMSPWQKVAFDWCMANPGKRLVLSSDRPIVEYRISTQSEYVLFDLLDKTARVHKQWVCCDRYRKMLVTSENSLPASSEEKLQ